MKTNYLIQRISLCANPDLERFVTLHNVGLSDKPGKCFIVSADTNLADGIMRCDLKRAEDFKQEISSEWKPGMSSQISKARYTRPDTQS